MSLRRLNPKRDGNEPEIIDALERCGFTVERLSQRGIPDLLCSRRGTFYVIEVKAPKRTLTTDQERFRDRHKAPVNVVQTPLQAVQWAQTVP